MTKQEQLFAVLETCRGLDADVRYRSDQDYFTVLAWYDKKNEHVETQIQEHLKQLSAGYPNVVFRRVDSFSTLIYVL